MESYETDPMLQERNASVGDTPGSPQGGTAPGKRGWLHGHSTPDSVRRKVQSGRWQAMEVRFRYLIQFVVLTMSAELT